MIKVVFCGRDKVRIKDEGKKPAGSAQTSSPPEDNFKVVEEETRKTREDVDKIRKALSPLSSSRSVDEAVRQYKLLRAEIDCAKAKRELQQELNKLEKETQKLEAELVGPVVSTPGK